MSYLWTPTLNSDVNHFSEEQLAYFDGASEQGAVVPWLRSKPANALQTKYIPTNAPGLYRDKTQGAGPNPRSLSKGRTVTALSVKVENSTLLSRETILAMYYGMNGDLLALLRSLGVSFAWTIHTRVIDWIVNNAFGTNWQTEGVPFYSAAHPTNYGGTQSNRLPSALDNASFKLACVMLDKTLSYDGAYQAKRPGWLGVASDAAPDTVEMINSYLKVPIGAGAVDGTGHGFQQRPFIAGSNVNGFSSPAIDDADKWILTSTDFVVEMHVVDPSLPKRDPLPGSRDEIISDESNFNLIVRDWRDAIGGGPD